MSHSGSASGAANPALMLIAVGCVSSLVTPVIDGVRAPTKLIDAVALLNSKRTVPPRDLDLAECEFRGGTARECFEFLPRFAHHLKHAHAGQVAGVAVRQIVAGQGSTQASAQVAGTHAA